MKENVAEGEPYTAKRKNGSELKKWNGTDGNKIQSENIGSLENRMEDNKINQNKSSTKTKR